MPFRPVTAFTQLQSSCSRLWLGPASSLFFVAFSVYAIIAEHLFDIRIIIKRTLLYSLLLAGIAAGYSGVEYLLTEALRYATSGSVYPWLTNIGGAVVVSFTVAPVRKWLEVRLNEMLFGRKARQPKAQRSAHQ